MTRNKITTYKITLLIIITLVMLPGCALLVVGAAGGTVAAVHDRRSAETILKDQSIENNAIDKLYRDRQLQKKIHINVTSYNYIVLLTGETLTRAARSRAIDIVRNLPKVRRVHNELVVADLTSLRSRTNDSWITSKVKTGMVTTKNLDASRIKVVTENSVVYLMGIVTQDEANKAVDIARNTNGVQRVVKLFEYIQPVTPPQPITPGTTPI
ncbi:MAG: BON domain-containing protein [Gammaproteobacteria bacterium]|nr:BON domain-containing protein [Gammaproteobacteria bacterium]